MDSPELGSPRFRQGRALKGKQNWKPIGTVETNYRHQRQTQTLQVARESRSSPARVVGHAQLSNSKGGGLLSLCAKRALWLPWVIWPEKMSSNQGGTRHLPKAKWGVVHTVTFL